MDIYFLKEYGKLHESIENGRHADFHYKHEAGEVAYSFILRPIPVAIEGRRYYDITTPYGYGGPVLACDEKGRESEVLGGFAEEFSRYCKQSNIVSEFIRFHPLLENYKDFMGIYDLVLLRETVGIDLRGDYLQDEYTSRCRNSIRKAEKTGVQIAIDYEGNSLPAFFEIYNKTMDRNNASLFYYFEYNYFKDLFQKLKGNCFLINALYEGEIISSSIFLVGEEYLHYHFSGTLPAYLHTCANQAIIHAAACYGSENGKKWLHLGGGATSAPDDKLLFFKKSFSRHNSFSFYVGRNITNPEMFFQINKMVEGGEGWNPSFFPPYASVFRR